MTDINVMNKTPKAREASSGHLADVKHKILILSGKGGVGKSTVAVNLAVSLLQRGLKVGLLDADLHGPSVPKLLGAADAQLQVADGRLIPAEVTPGLRVVSIAYLLPERDAPVVWRGPVKMGAIKQFVEDTEWGELDYLIVDLPPGTGDEPLSVAQTIPSADGAVVVTTPQDVSLISVRKSIRFARMLGLEVIGLVDNMNGFVCPHCGQQSAIFGGDLAEKAAREYDVPYLGKIPLQAAVARSGEEGRPFVLGDGAVAQAFEDIVEFIVKSVEEE
jgi:ATP-binding protein involved in chromosome partitioning